MIYNEFIFKTLLIFFIMNQFKQAKRAFQAMSDRVQNENQDNLNIWLNRIKGTMESNYLPAWYTTKCPTVIPNVDTILQKLTTYSPSDSDVYSAIQLLLVCFGISHENTDFKAPSFRLEFLSGMFKTKNPDLDEATIKRYMLVAMKNITLPSDVDFPVQASQKVMAYTTAIKGEFTGKTTLRDVFATIRTIINSDAFTVESTTVDVVILIFSYFAKGENRIYNARWIDGPKQSRVRNKQVY